MAIINPYLNFPGTAEEAFNFYRSVFGGEFTIVQRFKDTYEAGKLSAEDGEKLMHISLPISNGNVLMATDALEATGHKFIPGNNFSLSLSVNSEAEAEKLFTGLSAGGNVTVPLQKMFWGAYFGMCYDKFGVQWMVNYDYNEQA
jgi:PhnB protein